MTARTYLMIVDHVEIRLTVLCRSSVVSLVMHLVIRVVLMNLYGNRVIYLRDFLMIFLMSVVPVLDFVHVAIFVGLVAAFRMSFFVLE